MKRKTQQLIVAAVFGMLLVPCASFAEELAKAQAIEAKASNAKPLSENVKGGLKWLAEHQLKNGAWGQGEESSQMGNGASLKDIPSVADTCITLLAFIRSGSTPEQGDYAENIRRGVEFVCKEVEESDAASLLVTKTQNTRVQSKLGVYIDTFMASLMLAEVQEKIKKDDKFLDRVTGARDKVLAKIQKNQRKDGTWDDRGWASTIQQAVASKALNRSAQMGAKVDREVLAAAEKNASQSFDSKAGAFSSKGSAGVQLYSSGSNLSAMDESVKTQRKDFEKAREDLKEAKTEAEKKEANDVIKRYEESEKNLDAARGAVVKQLDDDKFIAGFGSNGGEEFLSYMNIGESLVFEGGDAWKKWDEKMTKNLNNIQNKDGSWSGHHCITGRTFCTSASLLTLMVDRCPAPIAKKIK